MQVNLPDGRVDEVQFKYVFVLDAVWRGIEFPERVSMDITAMKSIDRKDGYTYHPVFCVSIGSTSSICWASANIDGLVRFSGLSGLRDRTQVFDVKDTLCYRRPSPLLDLRNGRFLILGGCTQACDS